MPRGKQKTTTGSKRTKAPPATTPEARENQLISLAIDLVEQRLIDGTASSQETTHFLKLATTKARLEREILEKQRDLIVAKTHELDSRGELKELYNDAIAAFRNYNGQGDPDEY